MNQISQIRVLKNPKSKNYININKDQLMFNSQIIDLNTLASQLSAEDLLALLNSENNKNISTKNSQFYASLLGINEKFLNSNIKNLSDQNLNTVLKLNNSIKSSNSLKMDLVKQQFLMKSVKEQQLNKKNNKMTQQKLNNLLKAYNRNLLILVHRYRKKLE